MSFHKTLRCRYFEVDSGKPIKPYCTQGSRCRFVHPSDSNWNSRLKTDKSLSDYYGDVERRSSRSKKAKASSPAQRHRLSELGLREDIYRVRHRDKSDDEARLHVTEGNPREYERRRSDDQMGSRDEDRRVNDDRNQLDIERTRDRDKPRSTQPYNKEEPSMSAKTSSSEVYGIDRTLNRDHDNNYEHHHRSSNNPAISAMHSDQDSAHTPCAVQQTTSLDNPTGNTASLFRRLAKISNQALQNISAYEREGERMQALTELSSELSKATPTAAKVVVPALSSIAINQATYKERMDCDLKEMELLWEGILSMSMKRITECIDSRLRDAMEVLKREKEAIVSQILVKRKVYEREIDDLMPDVDVRPSRSTVKESTQLYAQQDSITTGASCEQDGPREQKRPRLTAMPSQAVQLKQEGIHDDITIKDILEDMRSKMDKQTNTLETLARENERLKMTLQERSRLRAPLFRSAPMSHQEEFYHHKD